MANKDKTLQTVIWLNGMVRLIDQSQLPHKFTYQYCRTVKQLWQAIRSLKVRGAPAIGAAAALGLVLGMGKRRYADFNSFKRRLDSLFTYFAAARPTAVNLIWALQRVREAVLINRFKSTEQLKQIMLKEALAIINEDKINCRKMADIAQVLLKDNDRVLTYCNTGVLATIDYGTALGVIYRAQELGKRLKVYVCETRPLLQGARLTCWELQRKKIRPTLICDNTAGYLMQRKIINKIFIGADRIAQNGDTANKIGSYPLAVLANFHRIPFYVVAPRSSFDINIKDGKGIPLERRSQEEVRSLFFRQPISVPQVDIENIAFDIVPHKLISGIITESGILKSPYKKKIVRLLKS